MSLNWSFRIKINSGVALVLFLIAFFGLLFMLPYFAAVEKNFVAAGTFLVGAFGGYLTKAHGDNKLDLEAAKANVGDGVDRIKQAAFDLGNAPKEENGCSTKS